MELYLRVTEGSPADTIYRLSEGEIILGRSKQCHIQLEAADISRQHARLLVMTDRVVVDNLSQHGTAVDDTPVEDELRLKVGQTLRLGKESCLVLAETPGEGTVVDIDAGPLPDLLTAPPPGPAESAGATDENWAKSLDVGDANTGALAGDDSTGSDDFNEDNQATGWADMTGAGDEGEDEDDKTRELHTRQGSLEEIDMMKAALRHRTRLRIFGVVGAVVAVIILAAIFWPRPEEPEITIDWPVDVYGDYLEKVIDTPIEGLTIICPGGETETQQDSSDSMTIMTRIGRDRDVDLIFYLDSFEDKRLAGESRADAIRRWQTILEGGDSKWNFGAPMSIPVYIGRESGVPLVFLPYTRIGGGQEWTGRARLIRLGSRLIVLRTEVDQRESSRAEDMLTYAYLEADLDLVRSYWEGNGELSRKPLDVLVAEAERELKRNVPVLWIQNRRLLAQVLRLSVAEDNTKTYDWAMKQLQVLNQRQSEWFNAKFLALQRAENVQNEAAIEEIIRTCNNVFSDPDDQRFHTIRNW